MLNVVLRLRSRTEIVSEPRVLVYISIESLQLPGAGTVISNILYPRTERSWAGAVLEEVSPVQLGTLAAAGDVFCEKTSNRKREAQSGEKMIYMKSNDIIRCRRRVLGEHYHPR